MSMEPLLGALERRLRALAPDIAVRASAGGPWHGYYTGKHLILMARRASGAAPATIEIAAPAIDWSVRIASPNQLDEPLVTERLHAAVVAAPAERLDRPSIDMSWIGGRSPIDLILMVIAVIQAGLALGSWVRTRLERAAMPAGSPARLNAEALEAARIEEAVRDSSLSLGCLSSIVVFFAGTFVALGVGAVLVGIGGDASTVASRVAISILWLLAVFLSALVFVRIRRRFPSPPQTRLERWMGRAFATAGLAVVAGMIVLVVLGSAPPSITDEQARWCLGPGSGHVDGAVNALGIERTWTPDTARTDPNFGRACDLAWDVTHR